MDTLHNPSPLESQIDKPVYWADLVRSCLSGEGRKFKWAGTTWQGNMHCIGLLDNLSNSKRALSKTSREELMDGYIFKLMDSRTDTPLIAIQTAQLFSVIWQECHRHGIVGDDDLCNALNQWSKKLLERMVFANWLLGWPPDILPQNRVQLEESLKQGIEVGKIFFAKADKVQFWKLFLENKQALANNFHGRGLADYKKYTLNMTQSRFLGTAPTPTNTDQIRYNWNPKERAKILNELKRGRR